MATKPKSNWHINRDKLTEILGGKLKPIEYNVRTNETSGEVTTTVLVFSDKQMDRFEVVATGDYDNILSKNPAFIDFKNVQFGSVSVMQDGWKGAKNPVASANIRAEEVIVVTEK